MRKLLGAGLLLMMVTVLGCHPPGKPDPKDKYVYPDKVRDFGKLYSTHCAGCHGKDGRTGPAPPLNDPLFRALYTEAELTKVLKHGQGSQMPPFGTGEHIVSADKQREKEQDRAEQIAVLVKGLKSWGDTPKIEDIDQYKYNKESVAKADAKSGKIVFSMTCAGCHGPEGRGRQTAGSIRDPAVLSLISEPGLHRLIITGRSDLDEVMPSYDKYPQLKDGKLTREDVDNLTALLAKWKKEAESVPSTK